MIKFLFLAVAICLITYANAALLSSAEVDDELTLHGFNRNDDLTRDLSFYELIEAMKPTIKSAVRNPLKTFNIIKELKGYYLNVKEVVEGNPVPAVTVDKANELVCHEIADASTHH